MNNDDKNALFTLVVMALLAIIIGLLVMKSAAADPVIYDTVETESWKISCVMNQGKKQAIYFDKTRTIDPQVSTPQSVKVFIKACKDPYRQPCGVCHE